MYHCHLFQRSSRAPFKGLWVPDFTTPPRKSEGSQDGREEERGGKWGEESRWGKGVTLGPCPSASAQGRADHRNTEANGKVLLLAPLLPQRPHSLNHHLSWAFLQHCLPTCCPLQRTLMLSSDQQYSLLVRLWVLFEVVLVESTFYLHSDERVELVKTLPVALIRQFNSLGLKTLTLRLNFNQE